MEYQIHLLPALERATGRKTTDEQAEEFEVIDDLEDTLSVGTARSRSWSTQARSFQSTRFTTFRRILDEFGMVNIPRSLLAPIGPDGFLPTQSALLVVAQKLQVGTTGTCSNPVSHVRRHKLQQIIRETEITMERC